MWQPDRQLMQDLVEAVRTLSRQVGEMREEVAQCQRTLVRRKDELITLEARVDRLERCPSIQKRHKIPEVDLPNRS